MSRTPAAFSHTQPSFRSLMVQASDLSLYQLYNIIDLSSRMPSILSHTAHIVSLSDQGFELSMLRASGSEPTNALYNHALQPPCYSQFDTASLGLVSINIITSISLTMPTVLSHTAHTVSLTQGFKLFIHHTSSSKSTNAPYNHALQPSCYPHFQSDGASLGLVSINNIILLSLTMPSSTLSHTARTVSLTQAIYAASSSESTSALQ